MRTGRAKRPLMLSAEEHDRSNRWPIGARSQAALARRARVVPACAEGLSNRALARKTLCYDLTSAMNRAESKLIGSGRDLVGHEGTTDLCAVLTTGDLYCPVYWRPR
jgi:hypothetical protein